MEKKNKSDVWNLIIGIALNIIIVCIIIGITILILSQLSPSNLCESYCNNIKGQYYIATDCNGDTLACSGFCVVPNKTIYCEDILKNITTMESYS